MNYFDDEFEESLPSNQVFVGSTQHKLSTFNNHHHQNNMRDVRSDSPPPPPPPPMMDTMIPIKLNSMAFSNNSIPEKPSQASKSSDRKGPFPFLKKNSRKEPSALNRSPKSPEKEYEDYSQNEPKKTSFGSQKQQGTADYWGIDPSMMDEIAPGNKNKNSQFPKNNSNNFNQPNNYQSSNDHDDNHEFDTSLNQSINIKNWKAHNKDVFREFDEFEKLEKEVDDEAFKSLNKTLNERVSKLVLDPNEKPFTSSRPTPINRESLVNQTKPSEMPKSSVPSTWGAATQPRSVNDQPISGEDYPLSGNKVDNNYLEQFDRTRKSSFDSDTISHKMPSKQSSVNHSQAVQLSRPVSALKKEQQPTSSRTMTPGRRLPNGKIAPDSTRGGYSEKATEELQRNLEAKAKELETELETYKNENMSLKRLRKQQETSLQEILHKREEMVKFCEEEKSKTLQWCDEQKKEAEKERKNAAKYARDSRQKADASSGSIRKEKQEIEGLQATIEKLKLTHESASKKWKLNENRLYSLIKEHSSHIENLELQVNSLEEQKILLLDFISQSGLRLPKNIRQVMSLPPSKGDEKDGITLKPTKSKIIADRGFVEEVDVEVLPVSSQKSMVSNKPTVNSVLKTPISSIQPHLKITKSDSVDIEEKVSHNRGNNQKPDKNPMIQSWARSSKSSSRYSASVDFNEENEYIEHLDLLHQEDKGAKGNYYQASNSNFMDFISNHKTPTEKGNSKPINLDEENNATSYRDKSENGRIEETLPDGSRIVKYRNGTIKEIDIHGKALVRFTNGDTKLTDPKTGTVVYYYSDAETTHTSFGDGLELYQFPNGQLERHYPDGRKEVIFPDQTRKVIHPDGVQESIFTDGIILREHPDGRKEVLSND